MTKPVISSPLCADSMALSSSQGWNGTWRQVREHPENTVWRAAWDALRKTAQNAELTDTMAWWVEVKTAWLDWPDMGHRWAYEAGVDGRVNVLQASLDAGLLEVERLRRYRHGRSVGHLAEVAPEHVKRWLLKHGAPLDSPNNKHASLRTWLYNTSHKKVVALALNRAPPMSIDDIGVWLVNTWSPENRSAVAEILWSVWDQRLSELPHEVALDHDRRAAHTWRSTVLNNPWPLDDGQSSHLETWVMKAWQRWYSTPAYPLSDHDWDGWAQAITRKAGASQVDPKRALWFSPRFFNWFDQQNQTVQARLESQHLQTIVNEETLAPTPSPSRPRL